MRFQHVARLRGVGAEPCGGRGRGSRRGYLTPIHFDVGFSTDRQTNRTRRQTDRKINREADTKTDRQADRKTGRQADVIYFDVGVSTDEQTDRQTDRKIDRQDRKDRQADRTRRQTDRKIGR